MAGTLNVRAIFGVKGNVANNVVYVEDGVIVYPAGNYLVKYNIATRAQEAFPCSERGLGVTAMAISTSRRYLAIAERSSDDREGCIVSVYNTKTMSKRRSMVTGTDMPCTAPPPPSPASSPLTVAGSPQPAVVVPPGLRSLAFSPDDQMIVAVGPGPESSIGVFSIDKGRVVACLNGRDNNGIGAPPGSVRVYGATFSPAHANKLVSWGQNALQYLSLDENAAAAMDPNALSHVLTPIPHSVAFNEWVKPLTAGLTWQAEGDLDTSSTSSLPGGATGAGAAAAGGPALLARMRTRSGSIGNLNADGGRDGVSDARPSLQAPMSPFMRQMSSSPGGGWAGSSPVQQQYGASSPAPSLGLSPSSSFAAEGVTFTAHAWMSGGVHKDDHNVVATRQGEILLFQRESFLRVLPSSPHDNRSIDVLCCTSKGFITAGEAGSIRLFELQVPEDELGSGHRPTSRSSRRSARTGRTATHSAHSRGANSAHAAESSEEDLGPYLCSKLLQATVPGLESEDRIRSMNISPSGDAAIFSLAGSQLLQMDVANANVKDEATAFSFVGPLSHAAPVGQSGAPGGNADLCAIVSMSAAVRKPLVATVGVDCSVRLWNFVDKCCDICKYYPEGPTSVALHPSGLQILVGFRDRLRLMNVLLDDLREVREYPIKGVHLAAFSKGGSLFAAVHGNVIMVYSSYTGEYVQTLRGHNGRIQHIQWAYNDATLLSVASDGAMYEWDMRDGKRAREFMLKGARVSCATTTKDGALLYTVGDGGLANADGTYTGSSTPALREIDMNAGAVTKEWTLPSLAGAIVLSNSNPKLMFTAGGEEGKPGGIRALQFPITPSAGGVDFLGAAAPVAKMMLSHDDAYMFVAGTDGCLIVFDVRDPAGRVPVSEGSVKVPWAEETLVILQDLEERRAAVRELRDNVAELQSNSSYNLRMREMGFQDDLKKMTERATTELEQLRQQADLLAEEKTDSEREFGDKLASSETSHRTEMQKREAMYQNRIMDEVEKYQALQAEVNQQRNLWNSKRAAAVAQHESAMARLRNEYDRRLEAVRERRSGLVEDVEGGKRDWSEMKAQMENDLDDEAGGIRRTYQDRLEAERDAALKFKGENGIMKKKFAALQRDIEENKESITAALDRQDGLRRVIDGLEKEIAVLRGQIYDKDVTIGDKEKRIYELKKKNQELEKFKFVLDYKIKELKGQVEPREAEIGAMRSQIKEVDSELEAYHKSNTDLDGLIGRLRAELDNLQLEATNLRAEVNTRGTSIRNFSSDLYTVIQAAKTPQDFTKGIGFLYRTHVPHRGLPPGVGDVMVIAESERQREHLGTLAAQLKTRAEDQAGKSKAENARFVEENLALISQIKSLREAIAGTRLQLKTIDVDRQRQQHAATHGALAAASAAARAGTASTAGLSQASSRHSGSASAAAAAAARMSGGSNFGMLPGGTSSSHYHGGHGGISAGSSIGGVSPRSAGGRSTAAAASAGGAAASGALANDGFDVPAPPSPPPRSLLDCGYAVGTAHDQPLSPIPASPAFDLQQQPQQPQQQHNDDAAEAAGPAAGHAPHDNAEDGGASAADGAAAADGDAGGSGAAAGSGGDAAAAATKIQAIARGRAARKQVDAMRSESQSQPPTRDHDTKDAEATEVGSGHSGEHSTDVASGGESESKGEEEVAAAPLAAADGSSAPLVQPAEAATDEEAAQAAASCEAPPPAAAE